MTGKAWVFSDDINTDVMAPGSYMKSSLEEMASHCLEVVDPDFAANIKPGDILVAGENFGTGSSREQAAQVLKFLGVRALVAKSFAGIFYRNALNFGLTAVSCIEVDKIQPGDRIEVNSVAGQIINHSRDEVYDCDVLPEKLLSIIDDGGLVAHLKKTLAQTPKKDVTV